MVERTSPQQPVGSPLKPEIVHGIPVQNPANSPPQVFRPAEVVKAGQDKQLHSENSMDAKAEHSNSVRKEAAVEKAKIAKAPNGSPPIIATVIACLVALLLVAAAVFVYRKGY